MNLIRLASILGLTVLATACASVPMAPPELDQAAKEFRTTPGKANIYVFRDESFGAAAKMTVTLNDRILGDTAAKTFLLATVDPGPQKVVSKSENDAQLEFNAEPGKNFFVWQEVKMGALMPRSKLHIVDEASAKPRVNACSLAKGELPFELPGAPPPQPAAPMAQPAAVPNT